MRFLISLLFAFIATAAAFPELHLLEARKKGNETMHMGGKKNGTMKAMGSMNPVKKECKMMSKMMELTKLAANQTKLDALVSKGKLNATEVQVIKDKAANATMALKTMSANTTLVAECNVIAADAKVKGECRAMKQLSKTAALANNQTALDAWVAKKKLNDTQVTHFKDMVTKAETKLKELMSNTTLTDLCTKQKSEKGSNAGSATTGAAASQGSSSPKQSTGGAGSLTLQTVPYIFVPALAGVFAVLL